MNILADCFGICIYLFFGFATATLGWTLYGNGGLDTYNTVPHAPWYFACRWIEQRHKRVFRALVVLLWPAFIAIGLVMMPIDWTLALLRFILRRVSA